MNRKYGIFATLLMFLSTSLSFAAQTNQFDQELYNNIHAAYMQGNLNQRHFGEAGIGAVEAHKKGLEEQKKAIQSSYAPALLKFISWSLALASVIGTSFAGGSAVGSYMILEQPQNIVGMNYLELLKSEYRLDQGFFTRAKRLATEKAYIQSLPQGEQYILNIGLKVPSLLAGSLIVWGLSRYLWNKAASYTSDIARLNQEIDQDENILRMLQSREFQ